MLEFFKDFIKECKEKHILLLAASSSFFFLLCLVPLTLLLLSFTSFIFETVAPKNTFSILSYLEQIVPDDIMPTFQLLFKHSKEVLVHSKNFKTLHYCILGISSLGFFGSIWKAVEIISNRTDHGTLLRTLKSFLSIAISFIFIMIIVAAPLIYNTLSHLKDVRFLGNMKFKDGIIDSVSQFQILGVNSLSAILLFLFFIFFFKFLLMGKANLKQTMVGSAFFTTSVVAMKIFFFNYILLVKENFMTNYGSLYSFMIFAIWIYSIIMLFYMSITFTHTIAKHKINYID